MIKKLLYAFVLLAISATAVPAFAVAAAAPPTILSYQGRLADNGGSLLGGAGTTYYFKFSLYDAVSNGNRVWPNSAPSSFGATVTQGVFTANIGDTANGYPDTLNYDFSRNSAVYLQVEVSSDNNTFETLSPRQQVTSVPYAALSGAVVGTTTESLFGTTTAAANSFVTMQATTSSISALTLIGAVSQSAAVFQIQNNSLQNIFSVSASGALTLGSALTVQNGGTGSTTLGGLLAGGGVSMYSIATSTATCGTGLSCSSFTVLGGSALTITNTVGYPFPSNATSTALTFSGGITVSGNTALANATSTNEFSGRATANTAAFGQSASTTISSTGALSTPSLTIGSLSGLLASAAGATYATATSTASCSSGISCTGFNILGGSSISFTNSGVTSLAAGAGISVSAGTGAVTVANTIGYPFALAGNATSSLVQFSGGASTTLASVYSKAYFGSSATTTIDNSGNVVLPSGSGLTITGKSDGCATFASGLLNSTGSVCGGSGFAYPFVGNATSTALTFSGGLSVGGTATISGGRVDYSASATSTLVNNVDNAFSFATSTTNTPALTISTRAGTNFGYVGVGTTSPGRTFSVAGDVLLGNGAASTLYLNVGTVNRIISTSTILNGFDNSYSFATSSTNTPLFSFSTRAGTNFGFVGIGTSSPGSVFSIQSVANFTSATTTFSSTGGVNLTNGCYAIAGRCIGYTVKLAAIYSTSTPGTNSSIVFTGAQNAAPAYTVSSATLALQSNTSYVIVETRGGGGGGGGIGSTAAIKASGGGGQGGYARDVLTPTLSTTYKYTVGAGGTAGAVTPTAGGTGGSTCFGTNATACTTPTVAAAGGVGGSSANSAVSVAGGAGGAGLNGNYQEKGAPGGDSTAVTGATQGGPGGGAGGGIGVIATAVGNTGTNGGGGSGAAVITAVATTETGGVGGAGVLIVSVYATSSTSNATGNDYAEMFPVSDGGIAAGDIVAVDTATPVSMTYARSSEHRPLAGVVSTEPGYILGDKDAQGYRPIALSGRVPTKVNLEGGPIVPGDRIAPSSVPGVGKKAGFFDDSVGIAMSSYSGQGEGKVMVFITLEQGTNIDAIENILLTNWGFGTSTQFASTTASSTATTTESRFFAGVFAKVTEWLASATNGIEDMFANVLHAKEKICVDDQCLTKDDVRALINLAHEHPAPADHALDIASSTPPTPSTDEPQAKEPSGTAQDETPQDDTASAESPPQEAPPDTLEPPQESPQAEQSPLSN
jgi:fibronectin-binding autotransporter adhesin